MRFDRGDELSERLRTRWAGMGGRLGSGFAAAGFIFIALAWNGAAGVDFTQGQIPYLLSGGAIGIGLIIVGAALIVTESNRRDRQELEQRIGDLTLTLKRLAPATISANGSGGAGDAIEVVTGRRSFHLTTCRLAQGARGLERAPRSAALEQGLEPCRVCQP